jgi:uncharacterized protein YgfB (UPF0149 family)
LTAIPNYPSLQLEINTGEKMDDKIIDKIAILAKLSAISDIQLKLQQDRNQLEEELREIEEYERKSNHN